MSYCKADRPVNLKPAIWKMCAIAFAAVALIAHAQLVMAAFPAAKGAKACKSTIVSIGSDVTEILYALGVGDCIVAVDTTSRFPPQALREKKSVGYMRALSAEGVLSTGGKLIVASQGAGPAESVKALKASSVPYVVVPADASQKGIAAKIAVIAKAVAKHDEGKRLEERLSKEFAELEAKRTKIGAKTRALFVLATQGSRIMVGGKGTSADAIFNLAGATNVAGDVNGFKPITVEALVSMAPDAIVVMRGRSGAHSADALLKLAAVNQTPAGRNKRIFEMSGVYLLGFGPRTPAAAKALMAKFYP